MVYVLIIIWKHSAGIVQGFRFNGLIFVDYFHIFLYGSFLRHCNIQFTNSFFLFFLTAEITEYELDMEDESNVCNAFSVDDTFEAELVTFIFYGLCL